MLTVGDKFPDFSVTAVVSRDPEDAFVTLTRHSYPSKWLVMFFWPKDFTFVCPTEIAEFGRLSQEFAQRDCQVLGVSVDSEYVHLAWRKHHPQLADLSIPMLSDIKRELCHALGVIDREAGVALRATFIVDPQGLIRFVSVNDMNVGRNPTEVLRTLDGLQTDELVPCGWQRGQPTLGAPS